MQAVSVQMFHVSNSDIYTAPTKWLIYEMWTVYEHKYKVNGHIPILWSIAQARQKGNIVKWKQC